MKNIDGVIYYSLYEYLERPAGSSLGEEVNRIAVKQKQKFVQQHVETNVYTGSVFCYTKEFLDEYFEYKQNESTKIEHVEEDDLPF
tara:strand:- start:44 stop:301 length:258 start_codon:yes stop_codon:yes gene_type:complete